jgi:hypothetical protein
VTGNGTQPDYRPRIVASGVPPDVEGGILPPGTTAWIFHRFSFREARDIYQPNSAGLEARLHGR